MSTGMIVTGIGIAGAAFTLILQVVLIPIFRRQRKCLLEELEK